MNEAQPGWSDVARSYEDWYQTPRGRRYDLLEKELLARLLSPARGCRLLEIGCGTGHFTRWLQQLGWQVCGLDLEQRMLDWAGERSAGQIPYCRADAQRLPFADNSFALSAMITTLESISRPQAALTEAIRVSRQGIILGILNSLSLLALSRRARAIFRPTIFSRTRFYSGPVLCAMIHRAARKAGVSVSVRIAGRPGGFFERLPLGAFFAVAVELKK